MALNSTTIRPVSRRGFLKAASLGAGGTVLGGLLVACGSQTTDTAAGTGDHVMEATPVQSGAMTADGMDAMHEAWSRP